MTMKKTFRLGVVGARTLSGRGYRVFGEEIRTLKGAIEAAARESECDRIIETIPLVRYGIEYGFRNVVRNVRGEVIRG